jgi:hypothetical protein
MRVTLLRLSYSLCVTVMYHTPNVKQANFSQIKRENRKVLDSVNSVKE